MEPTELGPLLQPSALFNTLLVYTMSHGKGILLLMALLENQPSHPVNSDAGRVLS